jgi:hypothetical protein
MREMGFSQVEIARGLKVSAPRVTAYVESCLKAGFELDGPTPLLPKVISEGEITEWEKRLRARWEASRQVQLAKADAELRAHVRSQLLDEEFEKGWIDIREIAREEQQANRKKGPVTRMIESIREWWQSLGW